MNIPAGNPVTTGARIRLTADALSYGTVLSVSTDAATDHRQVSVVLDDGRALFVDPDSIIMLD